MKLHERLWDFYKVLHHWDGLGPNGHAFQCRDVLAPNLEGDINVFNHYQTVFNLIASYHPLEVFPGWVTES